MNRSRTIAGIVVACALSGQLCWGQEMKLASPHRVPGYIDYSTGVFKPINPSEDFDPSVAATSVQTGTLVVNFTITIKSAIPTTSQIICAVSAGITEISGSGVNLISEEATVGATRTGSTAKCTVTIPYSWAVSNPTVARVDLIYNLAAVKTTAGASGLLSRSSTGNIATIPLPANGATTTQTVNAVL